MDLEGHFVSFVLVCSFEGVGDMDELLDRLCESDTDIYPSRGLLRSDRLLGVTKLYIQDKVKSRRAYGVCNVQ